MSTLNTYSLMQSTCIATTTVRFLKVNIFRGMTWEMAVKKLGAGQSNTEGFYLSYGYNCVSMAQRIDSRYQMHFYVLSGSVLGVSYGSVRQDVRAHSDFPHKHTGWWQKRCHSHPK